MSNLAAFGKLERTLAELDQLPRRLAIAVAPMITKELQKEFENGNDPYGRRWAKLSTGKPSFLTLSRKLRNKTKAAPMPGGRAGIRILLGARYAIFHQTGTRYMPARKILPERGMPSAWRTAIQREAKRLFQAARVK
jgi:hypothetical protein